MIIYINKAIFLIISSFGGLISIARMMLSKAATTLPWWKSCISLCSSITPKSHLDYLKEVGVKYIVEGDRNVNLQSALRNLNQQFHIQKVRVDCGGILNGVFLREGLVYEVSVIISPSLVGGVTPKTMFVAPDLETEEGVIGLSLNHVETIRERYVWLRYQVQR